MNPRLIATVVGVSWLNLSRDRVALVLTFVLPLAFFSVFAAVFGAMDDAGVEAIPAVVALEDESPASQRLAEMIAADPGLDVGDPAADRGAAKELVSSGQARIAVVIPDGFAAALASRQPGAAKIEILADRSHPIAVGLVTGLVQSSAMRLGLESMGPGLTGAASPTESPLALEVIDVLGGGDKRPSVAFFAAGLGVLFLLFAVSGRSGILLEEHESGVLERMLAARLSLGELLAGRWLYLVGLGTLQVTAMFLWAALVFGLELFTPGHLAGFTVMTLASAAVASAFALVLSAACRSRAQLQGISAVVILVLAVLGGNMFPSFLMPESLQKIGRLTFNAWALEGYQKVFWYDAEITQLGPQIGVLLVFTAAFLLAARILARRFQT